MSFPVKFNSAAGICAIASISDDELRKGIDWQEKTMETFPLCHFHRAEEINCHFFSAWIWLIVFIRIYVGNWIELRHMRRRKEFPPSAVFGNVFLNKELLKTSFAIIYLWKAVFRMSSLHAGRLTFPASSFVWSQSLSALSSTVSKKAWLSKQPSSARRET